MFTFIFYNIIRTRKIVCFTPLMMGCAASNIDISVTEKHNIYEENYNNHQEETEEVSQDTAQDEEAEEENDDPYCPDNMVSVRDEQDEPVFCIDVYEMSISQEERGNMDQGSNFPDGSTLAIAQSLSLEIPERYFSWYQAIALCQNAGKYLCSSSEWVDGCDGTYGSGGTKFPYGNNWIEGHCAARLGEQEQAYDSVQPTGSHPKCKSKWGTFDQIGNAWEWTDPQQTDEEGLPITNKVGASYYSGGGNIQCGSTPVANHPPDFGGTITARCCTSPTYPQ